MTMTAHQPLAEVLPYRARRTTQSRVAAPVTPLPSPAAIASLPQRDAEPRFVIHIEGHEFVTRESMAEMFLRKSGRVVVDGDSQLVPLLHEEGVELLYITPSTAVAITKA